MATSTCIPLSKSLFTSLASCSQQLRGDSHHIYFWPAVLHKPYQHSSLSVSAYHQSTVRIRRPSSQTVSQSRLYAAAASDAPGVRSVPVQVAKELVDAGHKYVDVRTPEEFEAGHPEGAVNVPFMHKHGGGMTKNQDFIKEMKDQFELDTELVVGCMSGKRSMLAATELVREEFINVTDVGGGFQAWDQSGLPVVKPARVA